MRLMAAMLCWNVIQQEKIIECAIDHCDDFTSRIVRGTIDTSDRLEGSRREHPCLFLLVASTKNKYVGGDRKQWRVHRSFTFRWRRSRKKVR
jgi:hypothetical protein